LNLDRHALVNLTLLGASGAVVVSLYYILVLRYYWIAWLNGVSPFSLLSISLIYMASVRSNESALGASRTIVYSALYCVAFLFSYEIVYHFTWPVYLDYFHYSYGVDLSNLEYLVLGLPLVFVPLYLMRDRIRFTKISVGFALAFVAAWGVWILTGFPQYFTLGTFYYPPIIPISNYWNASLILNFGSKLILAGLFFSMVFQAREPNQPTGMTSIRR
jgi:hypothetical protein